MSPMEATDRRMLTRFFSRVRRLDLTGCWIWLGGRSTNGQYGSLTIGGRTHGAHRLAYQMFVAPIPDGFTVDHLCFNKCCVNPAHLDAVDQRENLRRYYEKLTLCRRGHAKVPENRMLVRNRGCVGERCRVCRNENQQRYMVRTKFTPIEASV